MNDSFNRRTLLTAAGIALLVPRRIEASPTRKRLALELTPRDLILRSGKPSTAVWRFAGDDVPRFDQGDAVDVTISNRLPAPVLIQWRGLDGGAALEPLLARGPIATGGTATYALTLDHAGTLFCDARLGEGSALPLPLLPVVVTEKAPIAVDHDTILAIEDWHVRPDGSAMPPGTDVPTTLPVYTINGQTTWTLDAQPNSRLRLRFINGAQRVAIAVQLADVEVRVMAIDGQPSEPFLARDGRLVMAPGTRIDATADTSSGGGRFAITLHDGERNVILGAINVSGAPKRASVLPPADELASNGLPARLLLQSALRVHLNLGGAADPTTGSGLTSFPALMFRVKRGRTVVLALSNPGAETVIFRLHGHHGRLLDRLDDGWKPFWLDTIAVPGKQTVRLAFVATHIGAYLMEMVGTAWASRIVLSHYLVES